jgi:transposase
VLSKNTFHLVGLDKRGAIVMRAKVSRHQLVRRLVNLPDRALGHDARLIPAQYVKPFLNETATYCSATQPSF